MKTFQFICLKCGSENIQFLMKNTYDFSYSGDSESILKCLCVDCNNSEYFKK